VSAPVGNHADAAALVDTTTDQVVIVIYIDSLFVYNVKLVSCVNYIVLRHQLKCALLVDASTVHASPLS
jgi:hypothetical protein